MKDCFTVEDLNLTIDHIKNASNPIYIKLSDFPMIKEPTNINVDRILKQKLNIANIGKK